MVSIRQYCAYGPSIYLSLPFSTLYFLPFLYFLVCFSPFQCKSVEDAPYSISQFQGCHLHRDPSSKKNNTSLFTTSLSSLGPFTHVPLQSISHGDKRWPLVQSQQSIAHKQTINPPSFKFGITCSEKVHLRKKNTQSR